jgi:hypothetical protein
MKMAFRALAPVACLALIATPVRAEPPIDPFRFFDGHTESEGSVKVAFKRPFPTQSQNRGRILRDGTLILTQQVKEGKNPAKERRWVIRRTGPGRFSGSMTDATGPVTIEHIGEGYRFRFRMKGGLTAEQWVKPLPGGNAASSRMTIRKLGLTVATSVGTIRKLSGR